MVFIRFGPVQSAGAKLLAPGWQKTGAVRVPVPGSGTPRPDPVIAECPLLGSRGVRRFVFPELEHVWFIRSPEPAGLHHATPSVCHISASSATLAIRQRATSAVAQLRVCTVRQSPCILQFTYVTGTVPGQFTGKFVCKFFFSFCFLFYHSLSFLYQLFYIPLYHLT